MEITLHPTLVEALKRVMRSHDFPGDPDTEDVRNYTLDLLYAHVAAETGQVLPRVIFEEEEED